MDKNINYYIEDFTLSEAQKTKEDYLVEYTDALIGDLVNEGASKRQKMVTMRYYYHGIRDEKEFEYLTDNFGVGNPASIKFIPIVRNRLEALIGLMALASFDYKISVLDDMSIRAMADEELNTSLQALYDRLQSYAKEVSNGQTPYDEKHINALVEEDLKDASNNFRSVIVKACNNLIKVFQEDLDIDLFNKRKQLFEDLLVVGEAHYRVKPVVYGELPEFETLIPENFYYDIRRDQKYIKDVQRAVYVRYLTVPEIMSRYGHLLRKKDREEIGRMSLISGANIYDPRFIEQERKKDPDYDKENTRKYIRVYECEWISGTFVDSETIEERQDEIVDGPDKTPTQECKLDRYQSVRIGADLYLDMGKSEFEKRTKRKPLHTSLTFNGIRFSDRAGEPYSLLWKCKDLQDMHDILYFHRDNTIANAGTKGSRVDVSAMPGFLGSEMTQRVMKFLAYKKQGLELYDSTVEGADFQHFGDFDSAMSGDALTAINAVIQQLDEEASKQTGVTPQMMGIIEQREANSNVKQGLIQSSVVIKNLFDHNDVLTTHLLRDLVVAAQASLQNAEYTGTYNTLVGPTVFRVLPEDFAFSDYNIQVTHTSDEYQKLQQLREYASQLAQTGVLDPIIIVDLMKTQSLTEASEMVKQYAKEDSGSTVQQLQEQIKELSKELEKAQKQISEYDQAKLQLEQAKLQADKEEAEKKLSIEEKKMKNTDSFNDKQIALKKEGIQLERDQLYIDTRNEENNEITNYSSI